MWYSRKKNTKTLQGDFEVDLKSAQLKKNVW